MEFYNLLFKWPGVWKVNDRSTEEEARKPTNMPFFLVIPVREDGGMRSISSRTDFFWWIGCGEEGTLGKWKKFLIILRLWTGTN